MKRKLVCWEVKCFTSAQERDGRIHIERKFLCRRRIKPGNCFKMTQGRADRIHIEKTLAHMLIATTQQENVSQVCKKWLAG